MLKPSLAAVPLPGLTRPNPTGRHWPATRPGLRADPSPRLSGSAHGGLSGQEENRPGLPTAVATGRVVLVDGDRLFRELLGRYLTEGLGLEIVGECGVGSDALAIIRETRPTWVFLELRLAGLCGHDLLHTLRQERADLRLVVLSAVRERAILAGAVALGANAILSKQDDLTALARAVEAVREGRTLFHYAVEKPAAESLALLHDPRLNLLSERERQVLASVAEGLSNKEIATRLDVSVKTVEAHRARLGTKLKLRSTAQLTLFAHRTGLV